MTLFQTYANTPINYSLFLQIDFMALFQRCRYRFHITRDILRFVICPHQVESLNYLAVDRTIIADTSCL